MIKSDIRIALEMIDNLSNEEQKLEYLNKIKNMLLEQKEEASREEHKFEGYNFSEILKKASLQEKPISLTELHKEITTLKSNIRDITKEIQQLKEKDLIHEIHYLELTSKNQSLFMLTEFTRRGLS